MNKETDAVSRSLKRDEMIKYAFDLFYKNGFHDTGVDTIMGGTGISKRTLYKHFISKEGLITAAIDYYHQMMLKIITAYLEETTLKNPVEKVLRIFDFLAERVDAGYLDGCFAMNAKTEYVHKAKEIEDAYDAYVAEIQQMIERYLIEGNLANSQALATQIIIIFEGAIVRSKGTGNSEPVKLAKAAATLICNQ